MNRWETLLAIDHDKWACATYRANLPAVRVECGNVADYLDALPDADVVLGGPPCQPHSLAGKREASSDSRDGGPDFVAAVDRKRPRMFLMENVPGLLSSENGAYAARLLAALESAGTGYVVQIKTLDAVNFGVPQFRNRCWFWGIRCDLYMDGLRHSWPLATHEWPPPDESMFGETLLPGVTVGEALGLDGSISQPRGPKWQTTARVRTCDEPSPTVPAGSRTGGGDTLLIQWHADPAQSVEQPAPTLRSGGSGHDGCCLRLEAHGNFVGGKFNPAQPAPTLRNCLPGCSDLIVEYRWSDAYREKHPPASPASSVVEQWHKGLPNGALIVAENWKRKGDLWIRRLAPLECLRLQSGPDDFAWPHGIGKTAMYRVIGNGWACGMAAVMSRALADADPDSNTLIDLFCGGGLGAVGWHQRYWSLESSAPSLQVEGSR